jgi:sensor histidine kinase YesM
MLFSPIRVRKNKKTVKYQEMQHERIYWLCQVTGWSLYTLSTVLLSAAFGVYSWSNFASQILSCGIGLILTHLFRIYVRRHGWLRLSLPFLVPRIVIFCIFGAIVWMMLVILFSIFVFQTLTFWLINPAVTFVMVFNWSATLFIWSLIYFGFHFVENYKKTEVEKWKLEAAVKEAELRALKSQMNPHFIFNCLNNIRGLIVEDPERAQTVVTQLASILRYSLQAGDTETVTLEEELQTVSDYLALEAVRLEERLQVKMDIDPASLKISVPAMLVQTLVENGIKYGVATLPRGGEISLKSQVDSTALKIQITNSGQFNDASNGNGVGLKNSRQRLKLLFGEAASVTVQNASSDSVTAKIEIPIRREKL